MSRCLQSQAQAVRDSQWEWVGGLEENRPAVCLPIPLVPECQQCGESAFPHVVTTSRASPYTLTPRHTPRHSIRVKAAPKHLQVLMWQMRKLRPRGFQGLDQPDIPADRKIKNRFQVSWLLEPSSFFIFYWSHRRTKDHSSHFSLNTY